MCLLLYAAPCTSGNTGKDTIAQVRTVVDDANQY